MSLTTPEVFNDSKKTSFTLILPNRKEMVIGREYGNPEFRIIAHNAAAVREMMSMDELRICEAYMNQDLDFDGKVDMMKVMKLSNQLSQPNLLQVMWQKLSLSLLLQTYINRTSIAKHYEFPSELYFNFLDKGRAYSHGIFHYDEELLETAITRKLEFIVESCKLVPGQRVLDLGAGWGCAIEYLGKKGIHVDGITLSQEQADFNARLIQEQNLQYCSIEKIDFYQYRPSIRYDAIVSLGSIEHLPRYPDMLKQCSHLLKKHGYVYIDAVATNQDSFINSSFINKYIFSGNHRCLDIADFVNAVKYSPFQLLELHNDRHNYALTIRNWAQRLQACRHEFSKKWGEDIYRRFEIYLWGCCYALEIDKLQAYRMVLKKR